MIPRALIRVTDHRDPDDLARWQTAQQEARRRAMTNRKRYTNLRDAWEHVNEAALCLVGCHEGDLTRRLDQIAAELEDKAVQAAHAQAEASHHAEVSDGRR